MDKDNMLWTILIHLLFFGICYVIMLGIIVSIQHWWISLWEYGWIWNSDTMPPLVWWSILLRVLPISAFLSIIIAPIIYVILIIIIYHNK